MRTGQNEHHFFGMQKQIGITDAENNLCKVQHSKCLGVLGIETVTAIPMLYNTVYHINAHELIMYHAWTQVLS